MYQRREAVADRGPQAIHAVYLLRKMDDRVMKQDAELDKTPDVIRQALCQVISYFIVLFGDARG